VSEAIENKLKYYIPEKILFDLEENQSSFKRYESLEGGVLFFDLVQFTGLTSALSLEGPYGAELVGEILEEFYTAMVEEVQSYGGTIYQFAGDSALAAFQKTNGESDVNAAARICSCALAMKDKLSTLRPVALPDSDFLLTARFSISYGWYTQILLGSSETFFNAVIVGEAVDRTIAGDARGKPGEIFVSSEISLLLKNNITTRKESGVDFLQEISLQPEKTSKSIKDLAHLDTRQNLKRCAHFLDQALVTRIQGSRSEFLGEFREVTVVFVSIPPLDTSLQDTKARDQLNQFFISLINLGKAYNGHLIQTDFSDKGSVFMILFGAPLAMEKKELMALRFALKCPSLIQDKSAIQNIKTGISTGTIYCGDVGAKTRKGYSVLGEAVNLASRCMSKASDKTPVTDSATLRHCLQSFETKALPLTQLKGFDESIQLYLVKKESSDTSSKSGGAFIGRKKELTWMQEILEKEFQKGVSIGLSGEAGVGKTRLASEFVRHVRDRNIAVVQSACYPYEKHTPYFAWKSLYSSLFELSEDDELDTAREKISKKISVIKDENLAWINVFLNLLDWDQKEDAFTANIDPRQKNEKIYEITLGLVDNLAQKKKIMLMIEDFHWADDSSAELIRLFIAKKIPGVIIFLVSRPEGWILEFAEIRDFNYLTLSDMEEEDIRELLDSRLKLSEKSISVKGKIAQEMLNRAHGNPLFIESIVQSLREQGLLKVNEDETFDFAGDPDKMDIPHTLHDVLLSRIDRLSEGEKQTLKNAAVIGRIFELDYLKVLSPDISIGYLQDQLKNLEKFDFTMEEGHLTYFFKHILVRDVAYNSLLNNSRRILHNLLATHIESQNQDSLQSHVDMLAFHYGMAQNREKSVHYGILAARKAAQAYSNSNAIHHYHNVLEQLESTADGKRSLYYDVKTELGHVYRQSGAFADAIDIFQEPLHVVTDPVKKSRLHTGLGKVYQEQGETDKALAELEMATKLLGVKVPSSYSGVMLGVVGQLIVRGLRKVFPFFLFPVGKKKAEIYRMRFEILDSLTKIYFFVDMDKMAWANLQQVNLIERVDNDRYRAIAYAALGLIYSSLRLQRFSQKIYKRSLFHVQKSGDPFAEALYLQRFGTSGLNDNDPQRWYKNQERAIHIYSQIGENWEKMLSAGSEAVGHMIAGNFREAENLSEALLETSGRENVRQFQGWAVLNLVLCKYILGSAPISEILKSLDEGVSITNGTRDLVAGAAGVRWGVLIHCRLKDFSESMRYAKELFKRLQNLNNPVPHVHAGYSTIVEAILEARKHGVHPDKEIEAIYKKSLAKVKSLGKKFPLIEGYGLRLNALIFENSGKHAKAVMEIEKALKWYEASQNRWEHALTFIDAVRIIGSETPQGKDYFRKAMELCESKHYLSEKEQLLAIGK